MIYSPLGRSGFRYSVSGSLNQASPAVRLFPSQAWNSETGASECDGDDTRSDSSPQAWTVQNTSLSFAHFAIAHRGTRVGS